MLIHQNLILKEIYELYYFEILQITESIMKLAECQYTENASIKLEE